jgi:histidyl-tRNA synthetase
MAEINENKWMAKGVKDLLPQEALKMKRLKEIVSYYYELYGFLPLETPALEREEIIGKKYSGGEEIAKEIFRLKDQGKRALALRFDLTVPLARVASMYQLKMPFKRYQIEKVYRDGPIKKGRLREFYQADADILGVKGIEAEAEVLEMFYKIFVSPFLNLKPIIKVNDRRILDGLMKKLKIKDSEKAILTLDKLEKIGWNELEKELKKIKLKEEQIVDLMNFMTIYGDNNKKLEEAEEILGSELVRPLKDLEKTLKERKVPIEIDFSLARGLNYYTGIVFEIFSEESEAKVALAGGGRFDNMIGMFSGKEIPAVGGSIGLSALLEGLKLERLGNRKTSAQIYVFGINDNGERFKIAQKLRENGIKTDVDLLERNVSKNLEYANSLGFPFVLIVGQKELEENKVKLKNMESGEEELLSIEDVLLKFGRFSDDEIR